MLRVVKILCFAWALSGAAAVAGDGKSQAYEFPALEPGIAALYFVKDPQNRLVELSLSKYTSFKDALTDDGSWGNVIEVFLPRIYQLKKHAREVPGILGAKILAFNAEIGVPLLTPHLENGVYFLLAGAQGERNLVVINQGRNFVARYTGTAEQLSVEHINQVATLDELLPSLKLAESDQVKFLTPFDLLRENETDPQLKQYSNEEIRNHDRRWHEPTNMGLEVFRDYDSHQYLPAWRFETENAGERVFIAGSGIRDLITKGSNTKLSESEMTTLARYIELTCDLQNIQKVSDLVAPHHRLAPALAALHHLSLDNADGLMARLGDLYSQILRYTFWSMYAVYTRNPVEPRPAQMKIVLSNQERLIAQFLNSYLHMSNLSEEQKNSLLLNSLRNSSDPKLKSELMQSVIHIAQTAGNEDAALDLLSNWLLQTNDSQRHRTHQMMALASTQNHPHHEVMKNFVLQEARAGSMNFLRGIRHFGLPTFMPYLKHDSALARNVADVPGLFFNSEDNYFFGSYLQYYSPSGFVGPLRSLHSNSAESLPQYAEFIDSLTSENFAQNLPTYLELVRAYYNLPAVQAGGFSQYTNLGYVATKLFTVALAASAINRDYNLFVAYFSALPPAGRQMALSELNTNYANALSLNDQRALFAKLKPLLSPTEAALINPVRVACGRLFKQMNLQHRKR